MIVRERRDGENGVELTLTANPQEAERFAARFGKNLSMEEGFAGES